MIRRLRIKFILVSMASLVAVLLLILGGVNLLNYRKVVSDADSLLKLLMDNGGSFPEGDFEWNGEEMSPELPYETRYFSVVLGQNGEVWTVDVGKIAAVDRDTAAEYAEDVFRQESVSGFVGNYRYAVLRAEGEAETRILFLDCWRTLSGFQNFLLTSCWIALAGLLTVFVLIFFFSKRIVRPALETYEKQKRFITDAGHEIKTPLTIINANVDLLRMEMGESQWLQDIQGQTKRLASLTNDLIYLARMEEGLGKEPMLPFSFSDMVTEMAQSFQTLALTQNKKFDSHIQPMLSLRGNEKALRHLVSVLLDNALKYSLPEGEISLSLERRGRSLRLSVYNTSQEIRPDQTGRLFDRFYRTDKSRNSDTGGYGIGLSIASAVTAAHRGKIWASTRDGKSLTVTVMLPV